MSCIQELEMRRPGSVGTLHKEFGIKNFARYSWDLLTRQYDDRNRTDSPYGIVLYPRYDHNGAFFQDRAVFDTLLNDLGAKAGIRVMEAGSTYEIVRRLIALDKRYGRTHKISFAIVGGHGAKENIEFSQGVEKYRLSLEDLLGRGAPRTSKFFEASPTFILNSCSTGQEGGIGQKLSQTLNANVIAPEHPTSVRLIRATFVEGDLIFEVQYEERGIERLYVGGQRNAIKKVEKNNARY
jgi:hypothetical protein